MSNLALAYLIGLFLSIVYGTLTFTDKRNQVSFSELAFVFGISLFSWTGLIAQIVGQNIKHGHKE